MRKNRILLLAAIILTGVLVGYRGGSISYLLFYSTLMIPVLSLIYVFLVYRKFCIYQSIGYMTLVKEENVPYLFKLSNESIIAYTKIQVNFMKDYSTIENIGKEREYCLLPQEIIHKETKLCCHYRGEYNVGIDYVTVTDYLNLFHFRYASDSLIQVEVLPRVLHLNKLVIAPNSEDIKYQRFEIQSKQSIPDVEVRKYQPGDSSKMIHWKASARSGQLLTRKYTEEPKTELVLIVDFKRLKIEQKERIVIEDKIIETALAITDYFMRNNTPISVVYHYDTLQKIKICNKSDFERFYSFCSEVRFQGDTECDSLLMNQMTGSNAKQYCILLTSQINEKLCRVAYQYTSMEHELNFVIAGDLYKEKAEAKIPGQVKIYQIHNEAEVRDVLEVDKE